MAPHDPHSHTDLAQAQIQHIDFTFQVDFKARTVAGRAIYRLNRPCRGPLDLDVRGLDVLAIRRGEAALTWSLGPDDPVFGQRLRIDDLAGERGFEAEFKTRPSAGALQWLSP